MRLRKDALPGLKLKAAAGNQDAQYWLGMVTKDVSKAATMFRAAARQGHPLAGYELGCSLGQLGDKTGAVRVWQDRSLCADTAQVKWSLGICYREGNGVKKDTAKAFKLLE
jgi:TPR repeat protein